MVEKATFDICCMTSESLLVQLGWRCRAPNDTSTELYLQNLCVCESESRQGVVSQPPSNHSLHKQELELKGYAINAINKQSGKVS